MFNIFVLDSNEKGMACIMLQNVPSRKLVSDQNSVPLKMSNFLFYRPTRNTEIVIYWKTSSNCVLLKIIGSDFL